MRLLQKTMFAALAACVLLSGTAIAAGNADAPKDVNWSHDGPFGTYDRASVQRGMQVYREVCASCHSLRQVAFRTLQDIGLNEDEVKAIASEYQIEDGPDDAGDMFERAGKPSDYFPSPFANEQAARASNGGAYPPDLSLIVKARPGHSDYIYSLLTGYSEPPSDVKMSDGMSYNAYFAGHQIAMAPPLSDDLVEYAQGTPATVDQMARDVTSFLAWAGDPHMEARRALGVKVIIFLVLLTLVLYAVKRKVWSDLH